MSKNIKLKKAIIIATAIIGAGYSLHSQAIGLGDIQVKSYLGQPLAADLKVYGVNSQADASCFRLKSDDTNAVNQVSFKLNRTNNGNATLKINSRTPVFEPIASLTIMSTCDTLFTRQYNLLIDPAPTVASTYAGAGLVTSSSDNDSSANNSFIEESSATKKVVSKSKRKQSKSRKSRTKAKTTSAKRKQSKSNTRSRPQPVESIEPTERAGAELTNKPLLTISGTSLINSATDSMKLNFDRSINPNRQANTVLTDTEFSDEFTVMQNRISHLDKQLSKLSIQNASLKQRSQEQAKELNKVKHQNDFLRILAFCLGGALLASSYFFVDWLRRRNSKLKADKEQALWHAMQHEQEQAEAKPTFKVDESFDPNKTHIEVIDSDDLSEFENMNQRNVAPIAALRTEEPAVEKPTVEQVKERSLDSQSTEIIEEDTQLLDDAALFISHGRNSLAVQLLQTHLMEHPKESSSTWMYLLDLLANEGMEEEYKIAAIECNKHFNISIAEFSESLVTDKNSLESFERISLELQKIWGTPEAVTFLDELIYNTRIEPRMGFTKAVFEELSLLREIALDEIRLEDSGTESDTNEESRSTKLDLPETEVSDEFKQFGAKIEKNNTPKKPEADDQEFEFELLDIDR